jgi:hypothetical protein
MRIFNLSYRYTRRPMGGTLSNPIDRDESQTEVSFVWPVAGNWSVIGRSFHDFNLNRELDSIFGLEYTSCCYRLRVMGRRWLDNELVNQVADDALGTLTAEAEPPPLLRARVSATLTLTALGRRWPRALRLPVGWIQQERRKERGQSRERTAVWHGGPW